MPWGVAAAAITAGATLYSSSQQQKASKGAAVDANQGFNYLQNSPLGTSYLNNGAAANNQTAALLGVGGDPNAAPAVAPAATPASPAAGGQTPGMVAALGTALKSGRDLGGMAKTAFLNPAGVGANILGIKDPISSALGLNNNSALQDIKQALQLGRPISDASWAQAGYGPGGAALNGGGAPAAAAPAAAPGGGFSPNEAFGNYLNSTGTQFQLQEGTQALNSAGAARGTLNSGSTSKALIKFGQNLGSTSFDNYLKQLGGLSASGLSAGATIGGVANSGGQAAARITNDAGANQASNTAALGGMASSALGNTSVQNYLKGIF